MNYKLILIFLFTLVSISVSAQEDTDIVNDSILNEINKGTEDSIHYTLPEKIIIVSDTASNKKNPTKAALLSTFLPGAGQIYNGKYWKTPIVYFLGGGLVFWADNSNKQYHRYLNAYVALTDDDETTIDEFGGEISADNLLHYKKSFRKSRDTKFLMIGAVYLFNIIDASVDAHFSDYDVDDDLTLNFSPSVLSIDQYNLVPGFTISLLFK